MVRFRVVTGPNVGDTFSDATNSSGIASASYFGDGGVGTDLVIAWADRDGNALQDADEPALTALKTWTGGSGTAFSLSPVSDTNPIRTRHDLSATLSPAQNGVKVRIEVLSGPNAGVERSDRTNSSGVAHVNYTDAKGPGTDTIIAWADFDDDGDRDSGEPTALATKIWTSTGPVTSLSLSPASDSNPVGTSHRLTARVTPVQSGVTVRFEVIAGPNEGTTRSDLTNSSGVAEDSYVGSGGADTDTITAWADLDRDGRRDGNEPFAVATKTWTGSGSVVSIALTPASDSNPVGTTHRLTATVTPAQSGVTVRFEVVSGPNTGTTRSDGTNSSGVATTSYRGQGGPGPDTVIAWADLDRDGRREAGEPSAVATKIWTGEVLGTFISGSVPRFGIGLIIWGGGTQTCWCRRARAARSHQRCGSGSRRSRPATASSSCSSPSRGCSS